MHDCGECGARCHCDMDDMMWENSPTDCRHVCADDSDDDYVCAECGAGPDQICECPDVP